MASLCPILGTARRVFDCDLRQPPHLGDWLSVCAEARSAPLSFKYTAAPSTWAGRCCFTVKNLGGLPPRLVDQPRAVHSLHAIGLYQTSRLGVGRANDDADRGPVALAVV